MKYLALIAALITPTAVVLAQDATTQQLDAAKRAYVEGKAAEAAASAVAADVENVNVRIDLKSPAGAEGPRRGGSQTDVVISPGDPEFDAVLAAAQAAMARKAGSLQTELEATGVVVTPKEVEVEVVPLEAPAEK